MFCKLMFSLIIPCLQAINACGQVLMPYDFDGRPAVFGFGASVGGGPTSHCFALNFNEADPEVAGLEGVVEAYKRSFQHITLSGPTNFAPIIRRAAETAAVGVSQAAQRYTVLLMLTDGQCTDMDETTRAIIDASVLPLSIVIVGVGGADFSAMEFLDGDNGRLRQGSRCASRDIVQFVPFRKYGAQIYTETVRKILQFSAALSFLFILPSQRSLFTLPHTDAHTGTFAQHNSNLLQPRTARGRARSWRKKF
jgi:hypothetical protein